MLSEQEIDSYGIIPRCIESIFQKLQSEEQADRTILCNFLQIYNEKIFDLLQVSFHHQYLLIYFIRIKMQKL